MIAILFYFNFSIFKSNNQIKLNFLNKFECGRHFAGYDIESELLQIFVVSRFVFRLDELDRRVNFAFFACYHHDTVTVCL